MARPARIEFPGAFYHVTCRGNERKPIYRDARDRERFLDRLGAVAARHRLRVHAYVLMRNHFHLLLETPQGELSRAMGQLNGSYTQDFNRRHRRSGHLFQGRYKAILVEKDSYLLELSRYIHLNPVRVHDVHRAWECPWSSAAAYVGKARPASFLTTQDVLAGFGRRISVARQRYAEFLAAGTRGTPRKPWKDVRAQVLLGEAGWVERMKRRLQGRGVAREEVVAAKQLRPRPPLSVVITQVCRAAQVDRESVLRPHGQRGGWARPLAMALGWQVCGLTQREIGREFGVSLYAVSKAITRAHELAAERGRRGRAVRQLYSSFKD